MMAGKMMAGVIRRTPLPPLKLELEETVGALRKKGKEKKEEVEEEVEVETTSAGTAVRFV